MVGSAGLAGSNTDVPAVPFFRRIMDDIRAQIRNGTLRPGQRLPSTRDLATHYDVSPGTVRAAIDRLLESGELLGHQGVGVFVAEKGLTDG